MSWGRILAADDGGDNVGCQQGQTQDVEREGMHDDLANACAGAICEIRKAACRNNLGPVVDLTIPAGGPVPWQITQKCLSDIQKCPSNVLAQLGGAAVQPIVDWYIAYLNSQANGRWQGLDPWFINRVQQFYSVNLYNVHYATGINTIHGQNMTVGNNIFFTQQLNLNNPNDAKLMYHELEHVVQYANRGGMSISAGSFAIWLEPLP